MFTTHTDQIQGLSLPYKTLCLTFDDGPGETLGEGPGPKTLELAQYLAGQGIRATFFAVGRHVAQHPHILPKVVELGHTVGNHTYTHPHMTVLFQQRDDMMVEILKTTELIRDVIPRDTVYFRAPYGDWSPEISDFLNHNLKDGLDYVGPFSWEINGEDFAFWNRKDSAESCANHYLKEIIRVGRGIVVMHDSTSDNDHMKANNRTCEAVMILVPKLKALGFKFVSLEEIPGIA